MSSAIASGGQSEVPEGVQMMWEAELGVARLIIELRWPTAQNLQDPGEKANVLL